MARLEYSTEPLTRNNRKTIPLDITGEQTLASVLNAGGVTDQYKDDLDIYVNGLKIDEPWESTRLLGTEDLIYVFPNVHGGGNTRMIAQMAIMGIAIYLTAGAASPWVIAAWTVGANLALNVLLPPEVPPVPDDLSPAQQYAIGSGENASRLGQPMPLVVGKHKFALDLAAQPYPSTEGGESYYYGVYTAGICPDALITDLQVGDTDITQIDDAQVEYSGADGALSLFPTNVDTVSVGVKLVDPAQTELQTTSIDTTQIKVDVTRVVYHVNSKGKVSGGGLSYDLEYSVTGQNTWLPFIDGNLTIQSNGGSTTPEKVSHSRSVTSGQYDVRITRHDANVEGSDRDGKDLTWQTLRSFQPDTGDYENQRRIAIRYKASEKLSGRIQKVNAIVSNKCPTWDGNAWTSAIENSNPAWWYLYMARGLFNSAGTRQVGGGIGDSEIDIEAIKEWGLWCDTKGLSCNFVFTQQHTLIDALNLIAKTGRASVSFHSGTLGIVYDNDNEPPLWVFNPSNMVMESFQILYLSRELTDGVKLNFADEDNDWKDNFVEVKLPTVTDPLNLETIRVPGITNITQAAKEANLRLAEGQYRRRRITFDADVEGLTIHKGAVIHVTHDIVTWAQSGRLTAGGNTTTHLNLDKEVTFEAGTNYILVRFPDGTMDTVSVVTPTGSPVASASIDLSQSLSVSPSSYTEQDIIWQFEASTTPGRLYKITEVSYSSNYEKVTITAMDEDSNYYSAENGSWSGDTPAIPVYEATVSNIELYENPNPNGSTQVDIIWDLHNGAATNLSVRRRPHSSTSNDANFAPAGRFTSSKYSFTSNEPEDIDVIFTPINTNGTNAPTTTASFTVNGTLASAFDVPNVSGLEIFGQGNDNVFGGKHCKFHWNRVAIDTTQLAEELENGLDEGKDDAHFKDYKVQVFDDTETLLRTEYTNENFYTYTYEKNSEDTNGDPNRVFTCKVWVRGQQNQLSNRAARLSVSNPAPPTVTISSIDSNSTSAFIDVITPSDLDYAGIGVWMSTTNGFTPSGIEVGSGNMVYRGQLDSITIAGLTSGVTQYFVVAAYDEFGLDALNYTTQLSVSPTQIQSVEIAENAIGNLQLAVDAVENENVAALAIDSPEIAASAIIADKIAVNSIGATKIVTNAITADKIEANAVTAVKINASAVTTNKLNASAVTADKIGANAVTAVKIIADAVTADKVAANAITAANGAIANLTVETVKIQDQAVTIPTSAAQSGTARVTNTNQQKLASVTFTSTGAPVYLSASAKAIRCCGAASWKFYIKQNGGSTLNDAEGSFTQLGSPMTNAFSVTHTPGSGSVTYELWGQVTTATSIDASNGSLFALETKK